MSKVATRMKVDPTLPESYSFGVNQTDDVLEMEVKTYLYFCLIFLTPTTILAKILS